MERILEFASRLSMHREERLPCFHDVSETDVKVDPCRRRFGSSRELGDLGEAPVVHRGDAPGKRRDDRVQMLGTWRGPHATLRFAYGLEFCPCASRLQGLGREPHPIARACTTAELQQLPGKMERAVTQVGRRVRASLNDREDIARLERGSDPASDRLATVGFHDANIEPKGRSRLW